MYLRQKCGIILSPVIAMTSQEGNDNWLTKCFFGFSIKTKFGK